MGERRASRPRGAAVSGARVFQESGPNDWGSFPGASTPRSSALALVGFVGLALLVGASSVALTSAAVHTWFLALRHPPATPPTWVFAPVWTVLYVLIGVAAWLVWRRRGPGRELRLWGWQLAANGLWAPVFFGLRSLPGGLLVLLLLLGLVVATMRAFARTRRAATWLMAPYLAWCCFAAYLNLGFWWLNPGGWG